MIDPTAEIDALKVIAEALAPLDGDARVRVLRWATDRFVNTGAGAQGFASLAAESASAMPDTYQAFAELYAAANPTTDAERALVAAYWFQVVKGLDELEAQQLNAELKHVGHRLTNVTRALDDLKNRRPQLIIQTRKGGNSKQARKKYRLTTAGQDALEAMLSGEQNRSEG